MTVNPRTLSWLGLFAVSGWLMQQLVSHNFPVYALAIAVCGVVGAVGTGSVLVAPIGLALGQVAAIFALAPRWNFFEIAVAVAAVSIASLSGLFTRMALRGQQPTDEP